MNEGGQPDIGKGLNEAALADHDREDIGGAGGSSGGGTIAGRGEPSGGTLGGTGGTQGGVPGDMLRGESVMGAASPSLGGKDGGIAAEAAALGDASGALADEAANRQPGAERLSGGVTGAEAIGQGAARGDIGSGTPGDKGDLGGGDVGRSPSGTASPGGEGRA
ncbi:MAG TPA: hypothetical protein VGB04_07915 [Allosphingosinicella sp.]